MQEEQSTRRTVQSGGNSTGRIPRGMEVLVKKAVVDPAFRSRLLEKRSAVAAEIQLVLTPAEKTMLDSIPTAQLETIIAKTKVHSKLAPILLTGTAAVILAALGVYEFGDAIRGALTDMARTTTGGVRPAMVQSNEDRAVKSSKIPPDDTWRARSFGDRPNIPHDR